MDDIDEFDGIKSKSQLKRDMLALQDIGVALTKLPVEQLAKIPLSDKLRETILETPNIKKHGAIKRHMQFIGKLMRMDESEAILAAYEKLQEEQNDSARRSRQIEYWRDELIKGDKEKLDAFISQHPTIDRQQLNQLIRNCQKEIGLETPQGKTKQANTKQGYAKKLFRFIRNLPHESLNTN